MDTNQGTNSDVAPGYDGPSRPGDRDRGPDTGTVGKFGRSNRGKSRRFDARSDASGRIDIDTTGPVTDDGNTEQKEAANQENPSIQEGIKLSVVEAATGSKRGRKPGSTNKAKLTATQAKQAGESAAKKICDFVSIGATWVTHQKTAQILPDEREAIEPPLSRILAKLEFISTLDTGSDVVALMTASSFYLYRVYVDYQLMKIATQAHANAVENNGHNTEEPIPASTDYQDAFATLNEY